MPIEKINDNTLSLQYSLSILVIGDVSASYQTRYTLKKDKLTLDLFGVTAGFKRQEWKKEKKRMKCFNCGAEVPVGNKFCPHCGASMSVGPSGNVTETSQTNPGSMNPGYQNQGYQNSGNMNPGNQNPGNVPPGYPAYGNAAPGGGMVTASMILGIIADLTMVIGIFAGHIANKNSKKLMIICVLLMVAAVICGITGFILAICALKKKTGGKGRVMAGLVCNSIIVILLCYFIPDLIESVF